MAGKENWFTLCNFYKRGKVDGKTVTYKRPGIWFKFENPEQAKVAALEWLAAANTNSSRGPIYHEVIIKYLDTTTGRDKPVERIALKYRYVAPGNSGWLNK